MDFSIEVTRRGDHTVVSPAGEVDFETALELKEVLSQSIADGDVNLVVDLDAVGFMESTGLGTLIGGRRRALAADGTFTLVCSKDELLRLFQVTGMTSVFTIRPTLEAAVAS